MVHSVIFFSFAVICASIVLRDDLNANAEVVNLSTLASQTHTLAIDFTSYMEKLRVTYPAELDNRKRKILSVAEESRGAMQRKVKAAMRINRYASRCQEPAQTQIEGWKGVAAGELDQCIAPFLEHIKSFDPDAAVAKEKIWKLGEDIAAAFRKCSDTSLTKFQSTTCFQDEEKKLQSVLNTLRNQFNNFKNYGDRTANAAFTKSVDCFEGASIFLKFDSEQVDLALDSCIAASGK